MRDSANRAISHGFIATVKLCRFCRLSADEIMIPLRDDIPSRSIPYVCCCAIGLCAIGFLLQITTGPTGRTIAEAYGMVPVRVSQPNLQIVLQETYLVPVNGGYISQAVNRRLAEPAIPALATFITCMFLHGGWMHFLGNMWFLYIFGDNVEDRLGHFGFALLYLGTGVIAGLSHYWTDPGSQIPTIGASGAIAGVMGAYALFYPHAKVQAVLPIPILFHPIVIPAPIFLGGWFLMQTYSGLQTSASSGVAWWAHIGGFAAGAIVALVIGRTPLDHGAVSERRF
jgi:membrane associated rhomboid family serine protease